jgi:hypothetical protein
MQAVRPPDADVSRAREIHPAIEREKAALGVR